MELKAAVKMAVRAVLVILNNVYAVVPYFIWMAMLLPLKVVMPTVFWYIEGVLFECMIGMVGNFVWSAGYTGQ